MGCTTELKAHAICTPFIVWSDDMIGAVVRSGTWSPSAQRSAEPFLSRYVTYCPRSDRYGEMNGATRLIACPLCGLSAVVAAALSGGRGERVAKQNGPPKAGRLFA